MGAQVSGSFLFELRHIFSEIGDPSIFQDLADLKEWQAPDILMEEATLELLPQPVFGSFLPRVSTP